MNRSVRTVLSVGLLLLLAACARQVPETVAHTAETPGFWWGCGTDSYSRSHGSARCSTRRSRVYAVPNTRGGWYDFGFFVGVCVLGGGSHFSSKKRGRADCPRRLCDTGRCFPAVNLDASGLLNHRAARTTGIMPANRKSQPELYGVPPVGISRYFALYVAQIGWIVLGSSCCPRLLAVELPPERSCFRPIPAASRCPESRGWVEDRR